MRFELWISLITAVVGIVGFVASRLLRRNEMVVWAEGLFVISIIAFLAWGGTIIYYTTDVDQRLSAAGGQLPTLTQPTEARFQGELANVVNTTSARWWEFWKWSFNPDADKIREWRAARSDHWLVAYAILNCKRFPDIENMSGQVFSALLLDLTPNGDHVFKSGLTTGSKIVIAPMDQIVLSLSDSIERARLSAVSGAAGSVVTVFWLGLSALIVSGLTTLFVTLQGKLKQPPAQRAAKPTESMGRVRTFVYSWTSWWGWRGYHVVAFLAIFLSIVSTTLAGVKQFYDPSRLVVQNQRTLPKLWSLHQDLILNTRCDNGNIRIQSDKGKSAEDKIAFWTSQIRELRSQVLLEYAAYGTPDQGQQPTSTQQAAPVPPQPASEETSARPVQTQPPPSDQAPAPTDQNAPPNTK